MPEENSLSLVNTVADDDKIRVVTSGGLSQSIEVSNLKNSLSVNDLLGRVDILETKVDTNETAHNDINPRIESLELAVGERVVEGGTITKLSGLFQEISDVKSDLTTFHLEEIGRLDNELSGIRADLTSINGTNGQLAILTDKQDNLESAVDDLEGAVNAGLKMISEIPESANATGRPGEVYWDAEYLYVCVATDTWKRTPLESW